MDSQELLILHVFMSHAQARVAFTEFCKTRVPLKVSVQEQIVWLVEAHQIYRHKFWALNSYCYVLRGVEIHEAIPYGGADQHPLWPVVMSRVR